jgi:cytochrome c oxidase cbb3-type subunit 1
VRSAHLNLVNYGWATMALIGTTIWLMPRLVHAELKGEASALVGIGMFNLGLLLGVGGILAGVWDGMEWLEMKWWLATPWLVIGGGLVGHHALPHGGRAPGRAPVRERLVLPRRLHLVPDALRDRKWPTWRGVHSAAANWFYAHNVLGFWLTAMSVGAAYYFIPKVLGKPVYSYQLSLLGFWTLAMFYSLNGMHHLVGRPHPDVDDDHVDRRQRVHVHPRGRHRDQPAHDRGRALQRAALLADAALRGARRPRLHGGVAAGQLHGAARGQPRHALHALDGRALARGRLRLRDVRGVRRDVLHPAAPRGHEWPSARLIRWHFNLVLAGIAIYVLALTWAGVAQGLALLDPKLPFQVSVQRTIPGSTGARWAAMLMNLGHLVFAYHVYLMVFMPRLSRAAARRSTTRSRCSTPTRRARVVGRHRAPEPGCRCRAQCARPSLS